MDVRSNIHSDKMFNHMKKTLAIEVRFDTFQFTQMFTNWKVSSCMGL